MPGRSFPLRGSDSSAYVGIQRMNSPSATQRHRSLKVALLSLNQRTQAVLEFFFLSTGRSLFVQAPEDAAEVVIFDADNPESRQHWERHHAKYRCPAIMLSVAPHELPDTLWLQKPFTPASLLAAGNQILVRGVSPAAPVPAPVPAPVAAPSPPVVAPIAAPVTVPPPVEKPVELAPIVAVAPEQGSEPSSAAKSASPLPPQVAQPDASVPVAPEMREERRESKVAPVVRAPERVSQAPKGAVAKALGFLNRFLGRADSRPPTQPVVAQPVQESSRDASFVEVAKTAEGASVVSAPVVPAAKEGVTRGVTGSGASMTADVSPTAPGNVSEVAAPEVPPAAAPLVEEITAPAPVGARLDSDYAIDVARYCGEAADVAVISATANPALFYQPEQYLFFLLREANQIAHKWRVPTEVDVDGHKMLVVPAENRIYISFDREVLSSLATQPLTRRIKPRVVSVNEFNQLKQSLSEGGGLDRIDAVLWETCMEAARGRIPLGTELDKTLYLRHWPNFTRLLRAPHAMQIAALWATRGASLMETAQMLRIEQKYVFAFFNAASALDLVTVDGSHLSKYEHHRKSPQDRGVLGRLFGWLKGKH